MATAAIIGRLVVNVEARIDKLVKGLNSGRGAVGKFASSVGAPINRAMGIFSSAIGIGGVVSLGSFSAAIAHSVTAIDALKDSATKLGVTTKELGGLRWAAKLAGMDAGALDVAMQRMQVSVSGAAEGSKELASAMSELGLSATLMRTQTGAEQITQFAEAISRVTNQSDKMRLIMKIFGRGSGQLATVFSGGASGLQKMADEAVRLGIAVSQDDATKVEQLADAWDRLIATLNGLSNNVLITFVTDLAESVNGLSMAMSEWRPERKGLLDKVMDVYRTMDGPAALVKTWENMFQNVGKQSGQLNESDRTRIANFRGPFGDYNPNTLSSDGGGSSSAYFDTIKSSLTSAGNYFKDIVKTADKALYSSIEPARQFVEERLKMIEKEQETLDRLEPFAQQLTKNS